MITDARLNETLSALTPAERAAVDALIRQNPYLSRQALQSSALRKVRARLKRMARAGNRRKEKAPNRRRQVENYPKKGTN